MVAVSFSSLGAILGLIAIGAMLYDMNPDRVSGNRLEKWINRTVAASLSCLFISAVIVFVMLPFVIAGLE